MTTKQFMKVTLKKKRGGSRQGLFGIVEAKRGYIRIFVLVSVRLTSFCSTDLKIAVTAGSVMSFVYFEQRFFSKVRRR